MSKIYAQDLGNTLQRINYYGTLDHWTCREIKESRIIGGNKRYLYEFYGSPKDTIRFKDGQSKALKAPKGYMWRTNNVYARVAGIDKCSVSVFPEKRGNGYCMRLEVNKVAVTVAGTLDIEVVSQGTFFLGQMPEPVTDAKDPMTKPLYGIPFNGRPSCLQFDYKANVGHEVVKGNGFGKFKPQGYRDYPEALIFLQKRWEDKDGNVHALRVGTGLHTFRTSSSTWRNGFQVQVHYGDISKEPYFTSRMRLMNGTSMDMHCLNSKGENVRIIEEGWASADETPNTLVINFTASCNPAFYGGVGNVLWIDNIRLIP